MHLRCGGENDVVVLFEMDPILPNLVYVEFKSTMALGPFGLMFSLIIMGGWKFTIEAVQTIISRNTNFRWKESSNRVKPSEPREPRASKVVCKDLKPARHAGQGRRTGESNRLAMDGSDYVSKDPKSQRIINGRTRLN
jgi:hypothetical protein